MPEAFNPAAGLAQERRPRAPRTKKPRKSRESTPAMEPEAEESALKSLGKKVVGGVAAVGNVLDLATGASSVRDILAGENPFDQFLSPTTSENRTGGRELLTKYGLTKPNDPDRWEVADFAGFGAEVALDPSTWFGVGLFGKAAKSAGALKTYAKGAGKVGQAVGKVSPRLGKLGAKTAELVGDTTRPVRSLFNSDMRGAVTRGEEVAGRKLSEAEKAGGKRAGQTAGEALHAITRAPDVDPSDFRQMVEGFKPISPDLMEAVDPYRKHFADIIARRSANGQRSEGLIDRYIAHYWPRRVSASVKGGSASAGKGVVALDPSQILRKDVLRDIDKGTDTIEKLTKASYGLDETDVLKLIEDPAGPFHGLIPDAASITNSKFLKRLNRSKKMRAEGELLNGPKVSPSGKVLPFKFKKGDLAPGRNKRLAKYVSSLSPNTQDAGLFGNHALFDAETALKSSEESTSMGESLMDLFADDAAIDVAHKTATGTKLVPIGKVLSGAGFNEQKALAALAAKRGQAVDDVAKITLPDDYAQFITGQMKGVSGPKAVHKVVKALDSFNSIFKMGVLTWPATVVRNRVSGMFRNITAGMWSPSAELHAGQIAHGMNVSGWEKYAKLPWVRASIGSRPVNAQTVTDALRERIYAEGFIGQWQGAYGTASAPKGTLKEMQASVPGGFGGTIPFSEKSMLKKMAGMEPGTTYNPLDVHGFGDKTETKFGPAAGFHDANHLTEVMNRVSPWLYEVRKGADPTQAATKVTAAQVDYSNRSLTPFERDIVSRALPFYRFFKGNTPYVLRQLWEKPGGRMASTIRGQRLAGSDEQGLPEHIRAQAPVALGNDKYLTGLGLMHEDVGALFGNGLGGGLLEMASRTNPVAKAPYELATGESFFQKGASGGRDLNDLDPTTGRVISNVAGMFGHEMQPPNTRPLDFAIGNSPLARLASSARTATDPRKSAGQRALNLLTGVRTTDVSPEQREYALADQIKEQMKATGAKSYSDVYYRKGTELTPEQEQLLALMKGVNRRKRARKKAKK